MALKTLLMIRYLAIYRNESIPPIALGRELGQRAAMEPFASLGFSGTWRDYQARVLDELDAPSRRRTAPRRRRAGIGQDRARARGDAPDRPAGDRARADASRSATSGSTGCARCSCRPAHGAAGLDLDRARAAARAHGYHLPGAPRRDGRSRRKPAKGGRCARGRAGRAGELRSARRISSRPRPAPP